MFIGGILLLTSLLQCSAKSVTPKYPDITQQCTTSSGQIYNVGSVFTDNNCTTRCECLDDSILSCQPLCTVMKANSFCANLKIVHNPVALPDAEGKSCSCPSSTCEPEFCYDGDNKYKPGEGFVSADCSGSCQCGPVGSVFCVSLCPPVQTKCGIDEEKVQSSRKIAKSHCTCPEWQCVKKKQKESRPIVIEVRNVLEKCVSSNGKIYAVDQVFTDNNCTSRCQCQEGGVLKCRPLCLALPNVGLCAKQNIIHVPIKLPDAEEKSCSCPLVMCEAYKEVKEQLYRAKDNEFCFDDGNFYSPGDRFVSRDCSSSCKCGPEGTVTCVSLCPPEDTSIKCAMNEEKIELPHKIANSNCTCPIWQCVKRKTEDVCIVGDKVYNPGDSFISTDCTSRCKCFSGKNIGCTGLCSPVMINCKQDEIVKEWSELVPDSKCSCPRWTCVKRPNEFCEVYGEKYKIGERFVTKDCTGYCRCTSSTSFGCVSLCPPVGIRCTPGTRKVRTVRPAFGGSNCTCPSWKCVRVESKWHPWSNWTECDAKCGGGLRYRFRKCMRNELCFGPDIETEVCNVTPCSQSYLDAPCGALRINSVEGDIWPRCDAQGYFEPLQCDPSASQCWCVDRWGNIEPGSKRISQKPQCGNNYALKAPST